ncbi:leukotriene B4 receptor 1-like [Pseudophryne corroboree]|uniref:leukotriene B4 receptor 1-like n=1 Tax=Pseudophryne corroboree TaxID=495146 RepID=UPI00308215FF
MSMNNTVLGPMTTPNIYLGNLSENAGTTSGSSPRLGIAILSVAFIIGFPGNAFIIWTVLTQIKKRTVTCLLILNLAMADIMVILTTPFFLHLLATGSWAFGNTICKMCYYTSGFSMYTSIYLITFMSIDRFLAVAIPFTSHKIRRKPIVRSIVVAIWVLGSLLSIPVLFYRSVEVNSKGQDQCNNNKSQERTGFQHIVFQYMFETIMGFVIPFTVILSSYIYIGLRLRTAKFQTKHKTNRLVIMIIVIFALFWAPYHLVNIIQVSGELYSSKVLREAALMARPNTIAFAFLSSSANPILYVFAGGNFIRTAGVGFMAKLFEATGSEANSLRKVSQVFQQKSRNQSVEQGKLGEPIEDEQNHLTM